MDGPVNRGWWRRNAIALVAIAVIVPVGVFALDGLEFAAVRNSERTIVDGMTTEIADWGFGPVTIESVSPEAVGAPPGTDPVEVTIHVDRGHRPLSCFSPTITEPATGRSWSTIRSLDWELPADAQETCTSRTGIPYDLVSIVLLPDDVGDRLIVGLTTSSNAAGPLDLRIDVER